MEKITIREACLDFYVHTRTGMTDKNEIRCLTHFTSLITQILYSEFDLKFLATYLAVTGPLLFIKYYYYTS